MTPQKQTLQECPKCRSLKTARDAYGFRCLSCSTYFPQSRLGNEKMEAEIQKKSIQIKKETLEVLGQARRNEFTEEEVDKAEDKINE